MAKINLTASVYRVARGKAEIAREEKWQKSAKLTTKKRLELKKPILARESGWKAWTLLILTVASSF